MTTMNNPEQMTHDYGEAEVDNRKRVSLSKAGIAENTRFHIQGDDEGNLILTPVASVPLRELKLLRNGQFMDKYNEALEEARHSEPVRITFTDVAEDDEQ